jgi:hypothetical protein
MWVGQGSEANEQPDADDATGRRLRRSRHMRPSLLCAYPLGDRDPHRKEGKEGMHQRRHDCCRARRRTWPTGVSSEWGGRGGADDETTTGQGRLLC